MTTCWRVDMNTCWQVDLLTDSQIDRLTYWHLDRLTHWQIQRLKSARWQVDTLTDWQFDMTKCWQSWHIDKLTGWHVNIFTVGTLTVDKINVELTCLTRVVQERTDLCHQQSCCHPLSRTEKNNGAFFNKKRAKIWLMVFLANVFAIFKDKLMDS